MTLMSFDSGAYYIHDQALPKYQDCLGTDIYLVAIHTTSIIFFSQVPIAKVSFMLTTIHLINTLGRRPQHV